MKYNYNGKENIVNISHFTHHIKYFVLHVQRAIYAYLHQIPVTA